MHLKRMRHARLPGRRRSGDRHSSLRSWQWRRSSRAGSGRGAALDTGLRTSDAGSFDRRGPGIRAGPSHVSGCVPDFVGVAKVRRSAVHRHETFVDGRAGRQMVQHGHAPPAARPIPPATTARARPWSPARSADVSVRRMIQMLGDGGQVGQLRAVSAIPVVRCASTRASCSTIRRRSA